MCGCEVLVKVCVGEGVLWISEGLVSVVNCLDVNGAECCVKCCMWRGLGQVGLNEVRLVRSGWVGLRWVGLGQAGLGWVGLMLGWVLRLDWVGLGWGGLCWVGSGRLCVCTRVRARR